MYACQVELLESFDISEVQGGLLALSEISVAYRGEVDDPQLKEQLLRQVIITPYMQPRIHD